MISKPTACTLTMAVSVMVAATQLMAQRSDASQPSGAPVIVTKVVARSLDRPLQLPGDLIAFQDVEIRAKVAGLWTR